MNFSYFFLPMSSNLISNLIYLESNPREGLYSMAFKNYWRQLVNVLPGWRNW
jgi:hypothetical protein